MNQLDNENRSIAIAYSVAHKVPIGATVVENGDGTRNISFPLPTEKTLDIYREAVLLHPDNADLRHFFSLALRRTGHPQDAIEQLHEAFRINPNDFLAHLSLAECYGDLHNFATAFQQAREAVRMSTEDPLIASSDNEAKARWLLGELLQKSGDNVAAREELNRALVLANTGQSACLITRIKSDLDAMA